MKFWGFGDPVSFRASCPESYVPLLFRYDHFRVTVRGFIGILITYHWRLDGADSLARNVHVVLNPSPDHLSGSPRDLADTIRRHPQAPTDVQGVIDLLDWASEADCRGA